MLAAPERVGSRGQQALSEMAGAQHLALTQRHVSEVITGGAAPMPSEGLKLPVVQETPLLHQPVSSSDKEHAKQTKLDAHTYFSHEKNYGSSTFSFFEKPE